MKFGAKIGFLLRVFVGILREEFSTAPTDDPEGNAGLGDLPSLPVLNWLRVLVDGRPLLVAPSNLHKGLLVAMRVWVLDNDGPTPHVVGVIM